MAAVKPPAARPGGAKPDPFADIPKKWKEEAREHDARIDEENEILARKGRDFVEQAGIDSFPASDPPARTVTRGARKPRRDLK